MSRVNSDEYTFVMKFDDGTLRVVEPKKIERGAAHLPVPRKTKGLKVAFYRKSNGVIGGRELSFQGPLTRGCTVCITITDYSDEEEFPQLLSELKL